MIKQNLFGNSLHTLVQQMEEKRQREEEIKKVEEERKIVEKKKMQEFQVSIPNALQALTNLENFAEIQKACNSIPHRIQKIMYIDRVIYEQIPQVAEVFADPMNNIAFHAQLTEIGIPLLCPYFRLEGANRTTHQDCTIDQIPQTHQKDRVSPDNEPVATLCNGEYEQCDIFRDRTFRAAYGLITLCLPERVSVEHRQQECLVDLQDLDDWWKGEGRYE